MILIAGQEENDGGGGYSPVLNTTFPLTSTPTPAPFYLTLENTSSQVQCPLPDLGLWPNRPFPPTAPTSSLQGVVWNCQGTSFRAMSGCWVTKRLGGFFFILRVGDEQSDAPRLQFSQHASRREPWVGALVGASSHQLQRGSLCLEYSRAEIPLWHPWFVLLIQWTAFCLLLPLDLPTACMWKKQLGRPLFDWNLAWATCCCCSKFSSFCFVLPFYSTWIWGQLRRAFHWKLCAILY